MKQACFTLFLAVALMIAPAIARAETPEAADVGDAAQRLVEALTKFGAVIVKGAVKEFATMAREHVDADVWHGPALEDDDQIAGGLKLRLYPEGRSKSDEHFQAETYYRFDQNGNLKAFEFSTTRKDKTKDAGKESPKDSPKDAPRNTPKDSTAPNIWD